jgi:hypothetical protein
MGASSASKEGRTAVGDGARHGSQAGYTGYSDQQGKVQVVAEASQEARRQIA